MGVVGRCGDVVGREAEGAADGGEKDHFADLERAAIMFFFVAEGAGHAAAAAGDDMNRGARQEAQGRGGLVNTDEGLLVAVAVEPNLDGITTEGIGGDAAGGDLAHDELVEKQAVRREVARSLPHLRRYEIGILVAETQDAGGLDADERRVGRHQVRQEADIADGKAPRELQAALGDGGATAFGVLRHDDCIAEAPQEPGERQAELRLLVVGELIGKQVHAARPGLLGANEIGGFVRGWGGNGLGTNKIGGFVRGGEGGGGEGGVGSRARNGGRDGGWTGGGAGNGGGCRDGGRGGVGSRAGDGGGGGGGEAGAGVGSQVVTAEELAEGVAAEGGDAALGGEAQDALQQRLRGAPAREEVVERAHQMAKLLHSGHPRDRERPERGAFPLVDLLKHLGADAGHVDI